MVRRSQSAQDEPPSNPFHAETLELQVRFGERLRQARLAVGLTQMDVSERSGVHEQYVSRVELGHKNLTLNTMVRLARSVGYSVSEMLHEPAMPHSGKTG